MVTDAGDSATTKAIFSNGPAIDGARTWTLDWQLPATIRSPPRSRIGTGLGQPVEKTVDDGSTLINFTVPGNHHGFRLMGLSLRFNQRKKASPPRVSVLSIDRTRQLPDPQPDPVGHPLGVR